MILGKINGITKSFDSKILFDAAKSINPNLILLETDYKTNFTYKDVEVKVIESDIINLELDTSKFSVSVFQNQIADFTIEELEFFLKDKRKSIVKIAEKRINELS